MYLWIPAQPLGSHSSVISDALYESCSAPGCMTLPCAAVQEVSKPRSHLFHSLNCPSQCSPRSQHLMSQRCHEFTWPAHGCHVLSWSLHAQGNATGQTRFAPEPRLLVMPPCRDALVWDEDSSPPASWVRAAMVAGRLASAGSRIMEVMQALLYILKWQ